MNNNYNSESQFELFPGSSKYSPENGKIYSKIKSLTLSLENIIVLSIIFIMIMIFFFSLGIERGKTIAMLNNKNNGNKTFAEGLVYKSNDTSLSKKDTEENNVSKIIIKQEVPRNKEDVEDEPVKLENISNDIFTIQVASFRKIDQARQEAKKLKGIGHDTFVLAKGSYSIVCVGKFAQKDEAREFSNKLKNRYSDLYVRRF